MIGSIPPDLSPPLSGDPAPAIRDGAGGFVLARGSFRPRPEDLVACYRAQLRWRYRRPQIVYWPLLASLTAGLVVLAGGGPVTAWPLLEPFCFMFALFAVLLVLPYVLAPWTARRNYGKQPNLRQDWLVEFSRFGLRAVTDTQDNTVAWSDYVGWSRDDRIWLVWQSNQLVQFIPARALSPDAAAVFERLVAHLPRR